MVQLYYNKYRRQDMTPKEVKAINQSNRNLAEQLEEILGVPVCYRYFHEPKRYNYSTEDCPGHWSENIRTGMIEIGDGSVRYQNGTFEPLEAFTLKQVLEEIQEKAFNYPELNNLVMLKFKVDTYLQDQQKPKQEQPKVLKVKI